MSAFLVQLRSGRLPSGRPVGCGLVLLLMMAGAGCSSCVGEGPLLVRKVLVDVEPAVAGVDREEVRATVEAVLAKARGIDLVPADRRDAAVLRVRVEGYGPTPGAAADEGAHKSTLALTVEVTGAAGEPTGDGYRGHAIASGAGSLDARSLVDLALRDALAQVLMTRGAADLKSRELIAWLDGDATVEQRRRAIRILGSRRERGAVDALSKVLVGSERDLQPLALVALTNIGDPGAIDAVIAYSDRQPPLVKKQCIEAVRAMGSSRGRAWLFTLSSGHPDIEVQQHATAALASLESQEPAGPAIAEKQPDPPLNKATR